MAQRVGRDIVLLFHDHGTRRGWVVSSTPRPSFTPGKDPVPIVQEAGWAPGPFYSILLILYMGTLSSCEIWSPYGSRIISGHHPCHIVESSQRCTNPWRLVAVAAKILHCALDSYGYWLWITVLVPRTLRCLFEFWPVSDLFFYEGHLESKERFAIKKYLLIIGKKKNMQVLSHTFSYFST